MADFLDVAPNPEEMNFGAVLDNPNEVKLDARPEMIPVTPGVANNRALKADVGLKQFSPGVDQLSTSILNGTEGDERQQTMIKKQLADRQERLTLAGQYMTQIGSEATADDYQTIVNMTDNSLHEAQMHPDTFWEKMYARHTVLATHSQEAQDAIDEHPTVAHAIMDVQEGIVARKEAYQHLLEQGEADYNAKSTAGKLLNFAETFVPFYTWGALASGAKGANVPLTGPLPGQISKDTYLFVNSQPTVEASQAAAKQIFQGMYANDPQGAVEWLRGLTSYTTSDEYLGNVSGLLDIASVVPAGYLLKGGKVIAKSANAALAATTRDAIKVAGNRTFRPIANRIVKGDTEGAAIEMATDKIMKKVGEVNAPNPNKSNPPFEDMMGELNSFFNIPEALGQDSTTLATEQTQRLISSLEQSAASLQEALVDPLRPNRIEGAKLEGALKAARANWNAQYPEMSDAAFRVVPVNAEDTLPGVDELAVHIGTKNGAPFKSEGAARAAGKRLYELKDPFTIKKYGDNQFYLEVRKPIDETDPFVRDIPLATNMKTPVTLKNILLGHVRSAADLISPELYKDYLTATYGSSSYMRRVQEAAKPFTSLRGKKKVAMNNFLQMQRVAHGEGGKMGMFSENQAAFEKDWLHYIGRNPTEQETQAYWHYRLLNDFGFTTYNISLLRDKLRQGLENFHLPWEMGQRLAGPNAVPKPTFSTGPIEGKFIRGGVDSIPWHNKEVEDASILIMSRYKGELRSTRMKFTNADKLKKELNGEDYQLIQLSPEGKRRLREEPGFANHPALENDIDFILTKEYETTHLPWQQIPYRPGGPVEFPEGWFVRQPSITPIKNKGVTVEHRYHGDINLFNFRTESQAREAAFHMDEARKMLLAGDNRLQGYLEQNLPFTKEEFEKLFKTDTNQNALLDINTQIYHSRKDQNINEAFKLSDKYHNMVDNKKSIYNLYSTVNLKNALERNDPIFTFEKTGDPSLPIFNLKQAEMLDPIATMERSATSLMRGRFIEDLKFKVSENFLAEFSHILKEPLQQLRTNPIKALLNAEFVPGADRATLAAAKNYRRVALNFLGLRNNFQKDVRYYKQKLADFIFEKGGEKPFRLVEPYLLHSTRDPIGFFRNVAFHVYLGLFNPVQGFLQAQTITHIAGVEGLPRAYKALSAGVFMRSLVLNDTPEILEGAARRASAMGFGSPEQFKESWAALKRTGFGHVGEEYAMRDTLLDPQPFSAWGSQFFDKGLFFFREGERMTRLTAWNAAYLRWRNLNPTAALNEAATKEILHRADLLNVNMSSAGQAAWNKGFASAPTQFASYQARLLEQFMGKRLTTPEKMRALLTYSIMYGAPVAGGISTYPLYEDVRQQLLERGIQYDDNLFAKTFIDGIGSMALEYATGTKFAYGSRFGPSGLSLWNDVFSGDKSIFDLLGGASGTTGYNLITSAAPVLSSLAHTVAGDGKYLPILKSDLETFARNVSSVNAAYKAYYATNLGVYISKNGTPVDRVTGWEGFVTAFLGTATQHTDDLFRMTESNKDREKAKDQARVQYNKYMQLAIRALNGNDLDAYASYWQQANLWVQAGGFREDEKGSLLSSALRDQTMGEAVEKKFFRDDPSRLPIHMDELRRKRELINGVNR